jgi:kynurenine formamidase
MCVPGCQEVVLKRLSRRGFLKTTAATAVAAAVGHGSVGTLLADKPNENNRTFVFNDVVDLTHVLTPDFPTYFGAPQLEITILHNIAEDGYNAKKWTVHEHTGTHLDAPFHFSTQDTADQIPVSRLVCPLAVVDIRAKAETNPDAQLTPDDLQAWEAQHGRLPRGSCVAMLSGWAKKVHSDEFRNVDENGVRHFPGFHVEAVEFLQEERHVHGIAVDTLSLDFGPSETDSSQRDHNCSWRTDGLGCVRWSEPGCSPGPSRQT